MPSNPTMAAADWLACSPPVTSDPEGTSRDPVISSPARSASKLSAAVGV